MTVYNNNFPPPPAPAQQPQQLQPQQQYSDHLSYSTGNIPMFDPQMQQQQQQQRQYVMYSNQNVPMNHNTSSSNDTAIHSYFNQVRRNCIEFFNDWSNCPFIKAFFWILIIYLVLNAILLVVVKEYVITSMKMLSTILAFYALKKQNRVFMAVFTGILAHNLISWLLVFLGKMPPVIPVSKVTTFGYWILGLIFIAQQGLLAMSIVHLKRGDDPHG